MKFKISQSLIGLTALAATSSIVALGAIAGPPEQSKAAIVLAAKEALWSAEPS